MDPDIARAFLGQKHRRGWGARGSGGRVVISARETAMKTKNLRRDPRASLCVFPDGFFGDWVQVEGTAEIISLPAAMELLVDYYRALARGHQDQARRRPWQSAGR